MARARILGAEGSRPLPGAWQLAAIRAGRATTPDELADLHIDWVPCERPMPVAAALRAAGEWDFDHPRDFDADDWWYRCQFTLDSTEPPLRLRCNGLATIADVWLNGRHVLHSDSMFLEHVIDITSQVARTDNELVLRFHALAPALAAAPRRPRARWRTGLVAHQALRWHRTTLVGHMPAWCPPVAAVGPWRPITLESSPIHIERASVHTTLDGADGLFKARIQVSCDGTLADRTLSVGDHTAPLQVEHQSPSQYVLTAKGRIVRPERWWPHTHGSPVLFPVRASVASGGKTVDADLGRIGFRTLDVDRGADGRGFGLNVNGVPIFCRGVCWTPLDVARLTADPGEYRDALEQLRDAGANMVRIPGIMVYEGEAFHDLCDELGILTWQDLMFANMHYPWADEAFARRAMTEVTQALDAIQSRPSLAIVCGNSEVDQQAAMLGLPPSTWSRSDHDHDTRLRDVARELAPQAHWLPTTPIGGTFPFAVDAGVSHYYGVGAYRRSFDDVRRSNVRFAGECLAFSNVPEPAAVADLLRDGERPGSHPRWKTRVPRDAGAGWDFEDVRDHYVEQLFGVNTTALRERDAEGYLSLGRITTGETMHRTFAEWRQPSSSCRGGLVWFARDLWPGAGWGIIDSAGLAKAAYWYLKRAWAPIALFSTDEGLNGLSLHAVNDTAVPLTAELRIALYRDGMRVGSSARAPIDVPPRGATSIHANTLFEGFFDLTYAYRFGQPQHDVVASTLWDRSTGALYAADCYFPGPIPTQPSIDIGLTARAEPLNDGYCLELRAERFAYGIAIDTDGFRPDDNYFHLEPGDIRRVRLRSSIDGAVPRGQVRALNGRQPAAIHIEDVVHAG